MAGYIIKERINPCPPATQINYDQQIKAKKNSEISSITAVEGLTDCEEWLKSLSNKEIRSIKRN